MYTITKGELWLIRKALEDKETEDVSDALAVVNSILDKNVTIEITEDQMLNEEPDKEVDNISHDEMVARYSEEELETEEVHRVC